LRELERELKIDIERDREREREREETHIVQWSTEMMRRPT
jgi:hypothetical protein